MRRTVGILAIGAMAIVAMAQVSGSTLLDAFTAALGNAKTLNSTYTVQTVGAGAADQYNVQLKKPNLARIDTPAATIVADGKEILTFDKADKTFMKEPESAESLQALFQGDELAVFAPFFGGSLGVKSSKSLGTTMHKGHSVNAVQTITDDSGQKTVTFYIQSDSLAHAAKIESKGKSDSVTTIWDAKSLEVNGSLSPSLFAFTAPDGSREITADELNSTKWHFDLKEALSLAAKTHKKVFVDFFATWCGPCKLLAKECFGTDEFKALGKKLVFCRVDVDAQKDVAAQYNITAMPTQMILDPQGQVLSSRVGYSNPQDFFGWIKGNL